MVLRSLLTEEYSDGKLRFEILLPIKRYHCPKHPDMPDSPPPPSYGGYGGNLTKVARDQCHTVRPATDTRYRPLLDIKPSDPSTVDEAQLLISNCGQQVVVITADQQIYKVILDNIWATQGLFRNSYPRLGGLHIIMNFSSSVDEPMVDTSLSDNLKHAFGGIDKMLSGKKFPQNVRAFSMLTEERLHKHMSDVETLRSWMHADRHIQQK